MDTTPNEPTTTADRIKIAITDEMDVLFRNHKISNTSHDGTEEAEKARKDAEALAEASLQFILTQVLIDFNSIARALEALAKKHGEQSE